MKGNSEKFKEKIKAIEEIYVGYPRVEDKVEKIKYIQEYSNIMSEPECLLITGDTGAGKSTIMDQHMTRYSKEITDTETRIPILTSLIPAPASVKGVAEQLLYDLGDALATKGRTAAKTRRLCNYIKDCRVELIILDEFQHLIDRDSNRVLRTVADWLKTIIIETGVPVVLLGMPEAEEVLNANPQLSRRFAHRYVLEPFEFDSAEEPSEFRHFLKAIDDKLPFDKLSNLADIDTAYKIYYATDGVVGYIMKLIRKAAAMAIRYEKQYITNHMLSRAFKLHIQKDKPTKVNPFMYDIFTEEDALKVKNRSNSNKRANNGGISNRLNTKKERKDTCKDIF